ncbi:MAG: M28 family peptidase [Armatimonadota bacterium]|nr:M28 family peptidase [Armatimonadota bacterium]
MKAQVRDLESAVVTDLSEENVWRHVRHLVEEIPDRISGGGGDVRAAAYFREELQACGADVEWCEMELLNSRPGTADLRVLSPETRVLDADCCLHIASTTPEGISGELVFVGPGGLADYDGKDVRGKIVLAEVSYAPATPEKARIAAVHGAVGIVLMNWGTRDMPYVPKRALKSVWGNPTPETAGAIPQVAGVAITRAAGEYLRDLCGRGTVRVRLRAESPREWQTLVQPIGRLKAGTGDGQFIIVSGHFDCWPPGATDNATGNGIMLELARVFARLAGDLRRSLVFAFWNGHEVAEAAGSTWYVDHDWDTIQRGAVAYLNVDSQGMLGATQFVVSSSPELVTFHQGVERRMLGEPGVRRPLSRTGDQSFFGIGVPSIAGRFSHAAEQVAAWNGATLGWWNHTDQDTLDKVDRALVARELPVWGAYLAGLAGAPVLPTRFEPLAQAVVGAIRSLPSGGPDQIGLVSLESLATRFADRARALDALADTVTNRLVGERSLALEDTAAELNHVLVHLSRLLTAPLRSVSGRYGQDSYGLSDLTAPVPALVPLTRLQTLPWTSEEARLLRTELRRRRNAVADGLSDAAWLIERTLARIR